MATKLHDPIHEPIHAGPDWDSMSDEQIMGMLARDDFQDKYAVAHLEPPDMTYQWARCEVFGKSDNNRIAEMEQKGWRTVPAERHAGKFMPPGTSGPIQIDGMMLFEMPKRVVRLKREMASRVAQEAVQGMNAQLSYAPPGTGPRGTHSYTAPIVRRESGSMPMVVE